MNLNDVLTKQNVFTKLVLTADNKELSKELKVKIMRIRLAYNKLRKAFDDEIKDFMDELMTDEFKELRDNQNRTAEEDARFNTLLTDIDESYKEFLSQKGLETVSDVEDSLSEDEYAEIVDVNSSNSVVINEVTLTPEVFLEIIYEMFVKED